MLKPLVNLDQIAAAGDDSDDILGRREGGREGGRDGVAVIGLCIGGSSRGC